MCSKIGVLYIETMALTVDQINAKFPYKVFPVVEGEPDYQIIHNMCTPLYVNSLTLITTQGGGNYGKIRLIMKDTLYMTISPTPYNTPMDPGGTSHIPTQATTAVRSQLRYEHTEAHRIH